MITAEYIREHYVGIPLLGWKDYLFGAELPTRFWDELAPLLEQEWAEVGDNERVGLLDLDKSAAYAHEARGNLIAFTVRHRMTGDLVGYFVGTVGAPLHSAGIRSFNEAAVYLKPMARSGWLFVQFLRYVEKSARYMGCDVLIVSHRPENTRLGRLYARVGFQPLAHDYFKRLDP